MVSGRVCKVQSWALDDNDLTATVSTTTSCWPEWNADYLYTFDASTTTSTTATAVWTEWNDSYYKITIPTITTSTTAEYRYMWSGWNAHYQQSARYQYAPPVQTAEQVAEAAAIRREAIERQAQIDREREAARAEAAKRAETLLKGALSAEQLREYESYQYFTVISADGQRRYRIRKGWSHNVERVDESGKRMHTLCAHPVEMVPEHDNMLAQKLMLEHSEDEFLKIANRGAAA